MRADLVIRGGLVFDGGGSEPFAGDIAVTSGRVSHLEEGLSVEADDIIDAAGLAVAPGFIDVHTHSDALPLLEAEHDDLRLAGVRQGVTTEVAGNCGFSLFPTPDGEPGRVAARHLEALFGAGTPTAEKAAGYRAMIEAGRMAANLASHVGQGTLRAVVIGFEDRPATTDEIRDMARLAGEALREGAAGLSTGLLYPPGSYAPTDEIVALARVAANHGRPYVSHIRNEMDGVFGALDEALEIGRRSGAPVHISHLKAAGPRNHGRMPKLLAHLEAARATGIDVTADVYPYTAGSTVLHALLPPWATLGNMEATLRRLGDPATRDRIRADLEDPAPAWQNFLTGSSWGAVTVASAPRTRDAEGATVLGRAAAAGVDPVDAVCDLIIENRGSVTVVVEMTAEEDVLACAAWPHSMIGSDGIPIPGKPHPRWAGSFARILGRIVREKRLIPRAEAIRKMTSAAADRFGLSGRGRIRPGAHADIVAFDPARVSDNARYEDPLLAPSHIPHVLVNGVPVIRDGTDTGRRPGRFIPAGVHEKSNR